MSADDAAFGWEPLKISTFDWYYEDALRLGKDTLRTLYDYLPLPYQLEIRPFRDSPDVLFTIRYTSSMAHELYVQGGAETSRILIKTPVGGEQQNTLTFDLLNLDVRAALDTLRDHLREEDLKWAPNSA